MQRTGEKPEKDSDIYQALLKQMQFEQEEMRRLREKNEELDVEHETLRVQRDEILERAKELTEERNRINNDPNLSPEQKVAQIKELWERERDNATVLKRVANINDQSIKNEIDSVLAGTKISTSNPAKQKEQEDIYEAFDSLANQPKLSENFNSINGEANSQKSAAKNDIKTDIASDKPQFPT